MKEELYAFEFKYNKGRLSKSKCISKNELESIPAIKINIDSTPTVVKCGTCNEYMDYEESKEYGLVGKWICPVCGKWVKETTVYNQFEKENQEWSDLYEIDCVDDIPEGCDACGGPYPDCIASCKLFDD